MTLDVIFKVVKFAFKSLILNILLALSKHHINTMKKRENLKYLWNIFA